MRTSGTRGKKRSHKDVFTFQRSSYNETIAKGPGNCVT